MGDLVLKGATSGQITITPTGVAGTNTLTLPAATGNIITSADSGTVTQAMLASNVAGNGPAFSAYQSSAQTPSATTWTKVQFQTKEFDTASCFDNTTNYRYTPNVAGYYYVTGCVSCNGNTGAICGTYKNGSAYRYGATTPYVTSVGAVVASNAIIYMNGTTDYLEFYVYMSSSVTIGTGAMNTFFQAFLARTA